MIELLPDGEYTLQDRELGNCIKLIKLEAEYIFDYGDFRHIHTAWEAKVLMSIYKILTQADKLELL